MKGIRMKLWSWLMLLVIAVLVLLWLFQVVFLEQFYHLMHFRRIELQVESFAEGVREESAVITALGNDALIGELEAFAAAVNLNVEIYDEYGNTLYQQAMITEHMFRRSLGSIVAEALSGETIRTNIAHMRFESEYRVFAMPLVNQAGFIDGCIVVTSPIEPVKEATDIIMQQLIYITLILLALASAIALGLSKQFSRPIEQISKAAKSIAKGHFDVRLDIKSNDEIGQLAQDVNEMGQSLGQIDRLRKELIGNVSHELRTPLSIIRGYAETLRDVTGDHPEKRNHQLEIIISESERLAHLIEDVLSVSQLESDSVPLEMTPFDVLETVKATVNRFEVIKTIEIIAPEASYEALGDRKRIEQVLYNLIGNAISHTAMTDAVSVHISRHNGFIETSIMDKGKGIPADQLKFIWDRFHQVSNDASGKPKGSGLGLAIVKAIMEKHQMAYGVSSKLGEGTTFWFRLKEV